MLLLVLFKKFLGKRQSHDPEHTDAETPEQLILRIQQGDIRLRNQFITDYQPYVAKMTSRFCKRYIDPSRDDEFSIALLAFNEAINQFSAEMGRSFFGFAETVVRRRLIDYVRKEKRFAGQIPYSSFDAEDEEENVVNPIEVHQAIEQYEHDKVAEERRNEIAELNMMLSQFGISFMDLVEASPKHTDSREALFDIARLLAGSRTMMTTLVQKKILPIKDLLDVVQVSRKTLERNRKFIIAIALIYNGPFAYLKDYLNVPNASVERSEENE
jgi:RNA polymerase sigma factor